MKSLRKLLRRLGYDIIRYNERPDGFPRDLTDFEREICKAVAPYTMTSVERIVAAINATKYIIENDVPGDIVECGVWRGGSMMAIAHTLLHLGDTSRKLYLYDTYEGMPPPTAKDLQFDGKPADEMLEKTEKNTGVWCYADLQDVTTNLRSTGYPEDQMCFVEGKVEDTIPDTIPDQISLLRLDTDWYESTRHELVHLYPRLASSGILIIDDYGHWRGSKDATDEYFEPIQPRPFLHRVDYTCRLLIKNESMVEEKELAPSA